jgi:hypothetical protein
MYWTDVIPLELEGTKKKVNLSRLDAEIRLMEGVPAEEERYEIPLHGRNVPFVIYAAFKASQNNPDLLPTCPVACIYPKGQQDLRTKVERVYLGTCRSLQTRDFGGLEVTHPGRKTHYSPLFSFWVNEDQSMHLRASRMAHMVVSKKVDKKNWECFVQAGDAIRVFEGFKVRCNNKDFEISALNFGKLSKSDQKLKDEVNKPWIHRMTASEKKKSEKEKARIREANVHRIEQELEQKRKIIHQEMSRSASDGAVGSPSSSQEQALLTHNCNLGPATFDLLRMNCVVRRKADKELGLVMFRKDDGFFVKFARQDVRKMGLDEMERIIPYAVGQKVWAAWFGGHIMRYDPVSEVTGVIKSSMMVEERQLSDLTLVLEGMELSEVVVIERPQEEEEEEKKTPRVAGFSSSSAVNNLPASSDEDSEDLDAYSPPVPKKKAQPVVEAKKRPRPAPSGPVPPSPSAASPRSAVKSKYAVSPARPLGSSNSSSSSIIKSKSRVVGKPAKKENTPKSTETVGQGKGTDPGWGCVTCTYLNEPHLLFCEMCDTPRPNAYKFIDLLD